jgi:hypothetical protein
MHQLTLTHWQSGIWKGTNTWLASQGGGADRPHFGLVGSCFVPHHPLVSYSLWLPYFGHIEDMHGFWSIWCFFLFRCFWNGRSTKLMELISNKHLSSICWIKFGYVGGRYVYFVKICMDFGPYDAFSSSNVLEMVDQQNLWNSLLISNYLLYLEWNLGMLPVDMCISWPPTPRRT